MTILGLPGAVQGQMEERSGEDLEARSGSGCVDCCGFGWCMVCDCFLLYRVSRKMVGDQDVYDWLYKTAGTRGIFYIIFF